MLKQRLAKISKVKTDIRSRHSKLQEIEGWYKTEIIIPFYLQPTYQRYLESKSTLKFTRWLLRNTNYTEGEVSEIGKKLKGHDFKISCRHNDLIRLGDTPHYRTCMADSKAFQQVHYLVDPDVAIAYVSDAAGKFVWRALLRLVCDVDGSFALFCYRPYGNGNIDAIAEAITKHTGLKVINAHVRADEFWYTSATKVGNPLIEKPYWSDHPVGLSEKNKLRISD